MNRLALVGIAALAVNVTFAGGTWTGNAGDMDVANPTNWSGNTLPNATSDEASLVKNSEDSPYVMTLLDSHNPYKIQFNNGPIYIDLGEGKTYTALYRFNINTGNQTYWLKSGTLGVDFNSSTGERFFMGDNGSGGNTLIATGKTARLTSSYKSNLQVGTNFGRQTLKIVDGAEMYGNVTIGLNRSQKTNTNNLFVVDKATHTVPSASTVAALCVGTSGSENTAIYTNNAVFNNESANHVYIPNCVNHERARGKNKLIITDKSTFSAPKSKICLGYSGDYNTLEVSGGAKVDCNYLYVTYDEDSTARTSAPTNFGYNPHVGAFAHNYAYLRGLGTEVRSRANTIIGGYSYDSRLYLEDGARLSVSNTFSVGDIGATNTFAYVGTNAVLDVGNRFSVAASDTSVQNQLLIDGGALYFTNCANPGISFLACQHGHSNELAIVNGALARISTTTGTVYIGNGTGSASSRGNCDNNCLRVANGANLTILNQQNIYLGTELSSTRTKWIVDNATVAITNAPGWRGGINLGNKGTGSLLEITNGGEFTFSNLNFSISCVAHVTNTVRVTNGSRLIGITDGSGKSESEKQSIAVGSYGYANLEVEHHSLFKIPHILRVPHNQNSVGGSRMVVSDHSTCEVYRVIMGEGTHGGRIYVSNSVFKTDTYIGTRHLFDAIQVGNAGNSDDHRFYIAGKDSYVYCNGFSMCKNALLQFDIGKDGFATDRPVLKTAGSFSATSNVTTEEPPVIRIVDDPDRLYGGTYTLIECTNSGASIDWSKFKIENDNPDVVVTTTASKLIARARSRAGLVIFLR